MSRKETDYATWRFLTAMLALPLFWGLEILVVGRLAGAAAVAVFALSLPISGASRTATGSAPAASGAGSASAPLALVPRARGAAAHDRAPGDHRGAGASQERIPRRNEGELLLSVRLLEEMSTPALDALDRARTVVVLTVSPLEEHGPHLPVGVDAIAARYFAETIAERLAAGRPGWTVLLAPTLHLGSFTFDAVGTVSVRQRVVRDALVD